MVRGWRGGDGEGGKRCGREEERQLGLGFGGVGDKDEWYLFSKDGIGIRIRVLRLWMIFEWV